MERGYSLLEIVVALGIMALIATVAAPVVIGSVDRMTLTADARAIATHVRELREQALDGQKEIAIAPSDLPLSAGTTVDMAGNQLVIAPDGSVGVVLRLTRGGSAVNVVVNRLTGRVTIEDAR
jgi:prepilin-type N-terminal cleavage/methylation domain-containing protein